MVSHRKFENSICNIKKQEKKKGTYNPITPMQPLLSSFACFLLFFSRIVFTHLRSILYSDFSSIISQAFSILRNYPSSSCLNASITFYCLLNIPLMIDYHFQYLCIVNNALMNFFSFFPVIQWTLNLQVHQKHLESPLPRVTDSVSLGQGKEFTFLITSGNADGARPHFESHQNHCN